MFFFLPRKIVPILRFPPSFRVWGCWECSHTIDFMILAANFVGGGPCKVRFFWFIPFKTRSPNGFPSPELPQYNSLTSHRPRHLGPDSFAGVVGRCQGTIADP